MTIIDIFGHEIEFEENKKKWSIRDPKFKDHQRAWDVKFQAGKYEITPGYLRRITRRKSQVDIFSMMQNEVYMLDMLLQNGTYKVGLETIRLVSELAGEDDTEKFENGREFYSRVIEVMKS